MRIRRLVTIALVASFVAVVHALATPVLADAPPGPPFTASVVVVTPSWDYENVALAYDVLPATDAAYGTGEVTGGPACAVPPVPYYLYDDTVPGDTPVLPGPGTGRYPDDPGANYELWEARGGPPGEYVVAVRWQNYCFRPDQPAPSGDDLFPQEQAHPQGQPVEVTATVAVYEAGATSPSSTSVLSGVVTAGSDRPAKEVATELGRVILPPTTIAGASPEASQAQPAQVETSAEPEAAGSEVETGAGGGDEGAVAPTPPAEEGGLGGYLVLILILLLVGAGLGAAAIIAVVLFGKGSAWGRFTSRVGPQSTFGVNPSEEEERRPPEQVPKPPVPTNVVRPTQAWAGPDPGPDDLPYHDRIEGPVAVIARQGDWARVVTSGGAAAWIPAAALGPGFAATATAESAEGWTVPDPGEADTPLADPIDGPVREIGRQGDWVHVETQDGRSAWIPARTLGPSPW